MWLEIKLQLASTEIRINEVLDRIKLDLWILYYAEESVCETNNLIVLYSETEVHTLSASPDEH